nr:tRNA lysidine(34) synthetase TilS [uncultured Enterobacter sp.]
MTISALAQTLAPHRQFLVAFSGGLDSTVLLHQLVCWREQQPDISLRAIHVHHGLSAFADAWAEHCEQVCARWQVPLTVVRVSLNVAAQNIEAQARQARYQAMSQALLPGEVLVTAQHLDDQCETLLLALKRGSGPAGLAAMPAALAFEQTLLLRPLLDVRRTDLEQWAQRHDLRWIDDDSNQDDKFDRNFLRLRVLPELNARWPHFSAAVARSAQLCGEQEHLLDELLADELASLVSDAGALNIAPLVDKSAVRRAALVRRWLASHHAPMPSRDALARLWQEVALAREDANPCLTLGDAEVRRFQGQLWWVRGHQSLREAVIAWPDPHTPLGLPDKLGRLHLSTGSELRAPRDDEPVSVRFTAPGTLHIVGRAGGRKLKKIWQELGVPPWLRDTTPLLFYGETLIAAAGQFITQDGQWQGGEGVSLGWIR